MKFDAGMVFTVIVATLAGLATTGVAAVEFVGLLRCHRAVEQYGLTPQWDPLTMTCIVKL